MEVAFPETTIMAIVDRRSNDVYLRRSDLVLLLAKAERASEGPAAKVALARLREMMEEVRPV